MINYIKENIKFYNSLSNYQRFSTREVKVGDIGIGGNNPIRIQSMTTTDTMDTIATVEQTIRMVDAGCEIVRITAPSIKDAENLKNIKDELKRRGYNVPLVADIHFTPNAAEVAARIVEKVRINPGNYVDKKKFQQIDYTDQEYQEEIERIYERFSPLVKICKEYGTAMRIGSNHGSLSDRIMSRYGDTPLGMVESAMEFIRICEDLGYYNIVLSMKASNPQVMIEAYRLLIMKMKSENMNYPLHLGVTEAGDGIDARVKSAIGIGALLEDGYGDTIRVSLTEDPEFEIPVAKKIVNLYPQNKILQVPDVPQNYNFNLSYSKKEAKQVYQFGGIYPPQVIVDISNVGKLTYEILESLGYSYSKESDKYNLSPLNADFIYINKLNTDVEELPGNLNIILPFEEWITLKDTTNIFPFYNNLVSFTNAKVKSAKLNFVNLTFNDIKILDNDNIDNCVFVFNAENYIMMRRIFIELESKQIKNPIVIKFESNESDLENFAVNYSITSGIHFIDGYGNGLWVKNHLLKLEDILTVSFSILQATRTRITKTEYIACPSCGRTLFNLQEVTNKIRNKTEHLKGVKIAVMGCIVNGLGEMADADYGYIGSGVGKISLFRGKTLVKKNVDENVAVDELIGIIKEDGKWVEP
jgi:(E)-4-hydroxy-3-methylbut-2-enyl-diphosphate synthase